MHVRLAAALVALLVAASCSRTPAPADAARASAGAATDEWFSERAKASGIDFVHVNGMSGALYMPEVLAPGVALFDYDNDGDLDVYLVQGQMLGGADARAPVGDRLYRNDLRINPDGTRALIFTDVTAAGGIMSQGYGMGVAAGDFNNDGRIDLYLTKFDAPNQLLRNNGDATFSDVSKASGTDASGWSVPASFLDFDRDGWLDLYVGGYLRYSLSANTHCFSPSGASDYCTPRSYPPLPGRLYRNRGNGTFADVTAQSRVGSEFGPALGAATADFNTDGWIDIYVANDGKENQLWLNQRNGTFRNDALLAGVALPVDGKAEGSMGVDAGDADNDGDDDLFMTELTGEGSNLYLNDGSGTFVDRSAASGLGPGSVTSTGFGTAWVDVDNDGWLDILSVNGTVQIIEALRQARDPLPLRQPKLLFRNLGNTRFEDVTSRAGAAFQLPEVSRGAAFGDVDNDGDTDVVVGNNNGPTRLFINQIGARKHWLGLRLVGESGRDMPGARVEIVRGDGTRVWRRVRTDGSYASAHDPRVLAGLGDSAQPATVQVHWPDGRTEEWKQVLVDRYTTLRQGASR